MSSSRSPIGLPIPEMPPFSPMLLRSEQMMLTLDKDFGELAIVRGPPHAGIIRLVDCPAAQQGQRAVAVLAMYAGDLRQGAIVTAEPGRTRVRLKSR